MEKTQELATFEDRYGRTRTIHKTKQGIRIKQDQGDSIPIRMIDAIAPLIAARIKAERLRQGLTLEQLCVKAGIAHGPSGAKSRMWEIETTGVRRQGIRTGTLYAIALALGVSPASLMPSLDEACEAAGIRKQLVERVVIDTTAKP